VLAVVQDEQHAHAAQSRDDRIGQVLTGQFAHVQDSSDAGDDRIAFGHAREVDEVHPVGVLRQPDIACQLHGEAGLARPARPDEGQQPIAPEQVLEAVQFGAPPDEPADRGRQRGVVRRVDRRVPTGNRRR